MMPMTPVQTPQAASAWTSDGPVRSRGQRYADGGVCCIVHAAAAAAKAAQQA
jgi:hypothetical protein